MAEIKLEGLDSILKRLDSISEDRVNMALGKCCALVERSAKQLAPKDNGELRRSITSKVENRTGIVFTPLEYAPYVEYGTGLFAEVSGRKDTPWSYQDETGEWHSTSGQKPQPFMRPALNNNVNNIKQILQEELTK